MKKIIHINEIEKFYDQKFTASDLLNNSNIIKNYLKIKNIETSFEDVEIILANFAIQWDDFVPIVPEIYQNKIFLCKGNIRCQL